MVRIRLRRVGSNKRPSYRIVIIDREAARDSRYIESIGYYNPRTRPSTMTVKEDRALYWLSVGAQPSDPVKRILQTTGTTDRFARYRAGEEMEALVAEAEAALAEADPISPKTQYPAPVNAKGKSKEEELAAAAEALEDDAAEAEAADEAEAAEEAEATEEVAEEA